MANHRIAYADPLRAGRHPFQTYLLALCLLSGLPLLLGKTTAGSVEESLPDWLAITWGAFLFGGAGLALVGSYWHGAYANALTAERIGLTLAGAAGTAYAGVLVYYTGGSTSSFTIAAITLGFGLSCLRRSRDIAHVFRRALNDGPDDTPSGSPSVETEEGL